MESMNAGFILQIFIAVGSGAGVYAAIRADLARINERAIIAQANANNANRRLDDHLQTHRES